jgi:hypothetical protein
LRAAPPPGLGTPDAAGPPRCFSTKNGRRFRFVGGRRNAPKTADEAKISYFLMVMSLPGRSITHICAGGQTLVEGNRRLTTTTAPRIYESNNRFF